MLTAMLACNLFMILVCSWVLLFVVAFLASGLSVMMDGGTHPKHNLLN